MTFFKFTLYLIASALGVCILIARATRRTPNTREPKIVPPLIPIPLFGHLVGLYWHRTAYYEILSQRWNNLPIFSLSMPDRLVHVISAPGLMHSLHRNPRIVSFWVIEAHFTNILGNLSGQARRRMMKNLGSNSNGEKAMFIEGLKIVRQVLSSQGGVDDMNRQAAAIAKRSFDQLLRAVHNQPLRVDLWAWVQHQITITTTECIYGLQNPYRDPRVEAGFWSFADDVIGILLTAFLPKAFASKGIQGRETVVASMKHYFESNSHVNGSSLTKARYESLLLDDTITVEDMARSEVVNGIAILGNTVPTAFWTVFHVFSDPHLLKQVRSEVENITTTSTDNGKSINLGRLKDAPIIFSTIQEALRHRATGTGPRMVTEDIGIGDDGHLLRKGSIVIISNKALHFHQPEWGHDVKEFKADRFDGKTPGHAFRGFGGGANLCPGKGFAMTEVGAFIAMLVMLFDLKPVASDWQEPGQDMANMSLQIAPPASKVMVDLIPRVGASNLIWNIVF